MKLLIPLLFLLSNISAQDYIRYDTVYGEFIWGVIGMEEGTACADTGRIIYPVFITPAGEEVQIGRVDELYNKSIPYRDIVFFIPTRVVEGITKLKP